MVRYLFKKNCIHLESVLKHFAYLLLRERQQLFNIIPGSSHQSLDLLGSEVTVTTALKLNLNHCKL